ncbi:MAG: 30S ribosomal protein S24e [Candidatus Bathyarchaeota archaeon]|nr:30S ribosomal protein S24e [Candidatus Bathyarchaeota archaeon]
MKIKILNNTRNELLKRNEISFILHHDGAPTPSRMEVREELARVLKVDVDRIYIRKMKSVTGASMTIGEAHLHDSPENARIIEPKHIILRFSPQIEGKGKE